MKERLHIIVHGEVQGVFYRANTREKARALGLSGWVRNLGDGGVEIVAEGEKEKLVEMLEWCRVGPSAARVEEVKADWGKYGTEFVGFNIRY